MHICASAGRWRGLHNVPQGGRDTTVCKAKQQPFAYLRGRRSGMASCCCEETKKSRGTICLFGVRMVGVASEDHPTKSPAINLEWGSNNRISKRLHKMGPDEALITSLDANKWRGCSTGSNKREPVWLSCSMWWLFGCFELELAPNTG